MIRRAAAISAFRAGFFAAPTASSHHAYRTFGLTFLASITGSIGSPAVAQTTTPQPAPSPSTVSSDSALVGWAAGPAVSAEVNAEKTMLRVPTSANAMDIEHHLS